MAPHDYDTAERQKAIRWVVVSVVLGIAVAELLVVLAAPVHALFELDHDALDYIAGYVRLFGDSILRDDASWTRFMGRWIEMAVERDGFPPLMLILSAIIGFAVPMVGIATNPHEFMPKYHGSAAFATLKDIRRMGLLPGSAGIKERLIVLGKLGLGTTVRLRRPWGTPDRTLRLGPFPVPLYRNPLKYLPWPLELVSRDEYLMLPETLSVLSLAPPGCQPTGSKVLMADGTWKDIEKVRVGDVVLSPRPDGTGFAERVSRVFRYEDRPVYRVATSEGTRSYLCSDNHILVVLSVDDAENGGNRGRWREIAVTEFLRTNREWREKARIFSFRGLDGGAHGSIDTWPFTVEPVGTDTVHGFELEGCTQWYVTDGGLVTHNTGKTTAIVVPTILGNDDVSMIVNDVKPELAKLTSGWRATVSEVFVLEWAAEDDPDSGLFHPRWNPLSPTAMPPAGAARDLYIDRLANVLVPDREGGSDDHWTKNGRNALNGMAQFLAAKVEKAMFNDKLVEACGQPAEERDDDALLAEARLVGAPSAIMEALDRYALTREVVNANAFGTWRSIPASWRGREPSFPMLLDWLTEAQLAAQDALEEKKAGNPMAGVGADPMKDFLVDAVNEARRFGYPQRAVNELNQLSTTPDRERGSILSTALTGIGIFKNAAVRARTSTSDFSFLDVRGVRKEDGTWRPLTLYLCVNQEDAKALGVVSGLFVEALSAWLIAHKPNKPADLENWERLCREEETAEGDALTRTLADKDELRGEMTFARDGRPVGPFPSLFVLDEFPQMPKLRALIDGPAVGRGQKVSYLMIGQDFAQIEQTYGRPGVETLVSTTSAKVVLTQNNEVTAKRLTEMVGQRTYKSVQKSRTKGVGRGVNPWQVNETESLQGRPLIRTEDFLTMPEVFGPDKHVILFQQFMAKPIVADTPKYFLDPVFRHRVDPGAGGGYPAAPPMPEWLQRKLHVQETTPPTEALSRAPANRLIVFDATATCVRPDPDARVIDLFLQEIVDGEPGKHLAFRFDPGVPIHQPAEVKEFLGVTDEDLKGHPAFADHAAAIRAFIGGSPVLPYRYDDAGFQAFRNELERAGQPEPPPMPGKDKSFATLARSAGLYVQDDLIGEHGTDNEPLFVIALKQDIALEDVYWSPSEMGALMADILARLSRDDKTRTLVHPMAGA